MHVLLVILKTKNLIPDRLSDDFDRDKNIKKQQLEDINELRVCKRRRFRIDTNEYASIVRATLSQYELVMLFYNGFYHKKFKMLIEKYALINNLRIGLLASTEDINLYGRKIGELYSFEQDQGRNMDMEYKKSAFVYNEIS